MVVGKFDYSLGDRMIAWAQMGSKNLLNLEMENEGVEFPIYRRRGEGMEG